MDIVQIFMFVIHRFGFVLRIMKLLTTANRYKGKDEALLHYLWGRDSANRYNGG